MMTFEETLQIYAAFYRAQAMAELCIQIICSCSCLFSVRLGWKLAQEGSESKMLGGAVLVGAALITNGAVLYDLSTEWATYKHPERAALRVLKQQ